MKSLFLFVLVFSAFFGVAREVKAVTFLGITSTGAVGYTVNTNKMSFTPGETISFVGSVSSLWCTNIVPGYMIDVDLQGTIVSMVGAISSITSGTITAPIVPGTYVINLTGYFNQFDCTSPDAIMFGGCIDLGYIYDGTSTITITVAAPTTIPTVTTPTVTSITTTGATLGANVTSLGNPTTISARGTCWGTTPLPTTNCVTATGVTTGVFTQARAGLTANTTYYYRGYATNTTGTGYSVDGTFTTLANPCTLPWGGTITSGTSATAYLAPSVVSPAICTSQVRTCTNGALSGTYTNQACTVIPANTSTAPTITGPATLVTGQSGTYSFVATDAQGNQVSYAIDWNGDGITDVWMPAGVAVPAPMTYVTSGTAQSVAHSWATAGIYTIKALTQDAPGLNSAWTSYTVTVTAPLACVSGAVTAWGPCTSSTTCTTPPSPAQLTNQTGTQSGICPQPQYTTNVVNQTCSTATINCTPGTSCGDNLCNGSETILTCPKDCKAKVIQF